MHNRLAILLVAAALSIFGAVSATAGDINLSDPNSVTLIYGVNTAGIDKLVPMTLTPGIGSQTGTTGFGGFFVNFQPVIVASPVTSPVPVTVNIGVLGGGQAVGWTGGGRVTFPGAADPNNPVKADAVGIPGFARVNLGIPTTPNSPPGSEIFNLSLSLGAPGTFMATGTVFGGGNPTTAPVVLTITGDGAGWVINPFAITGLVNSPLLGSQAGGQTVNGEPWTGSGCSPYDPNNAGCQGTTTVTGSIGVNPTDPNGIQVTMVSPTKVETLTTAFGAESLGITSSVSTLRLRYLPEPGTLLLLGAGAAGLALVGIRRKK